jgi:hypothetical protein
MYHRTPWSSVVPGSTGYPWRFWQRGPASAQSPELEYRQLCCGEYFETLPARSIVKVAELLMGEGGDRGRRHPKILTMITAGARDENAPCGGWRRKE